MAGTQVESSVFGNEVVSILGSGFVVQDSGSYYIVTNFHVVSGTSNLTVTFPDGDAYSAKVVGSDPYSDLAVVSVQSATVPSFIRFNLPHHLLLKLEIR